MNQSKWAPNFFNILTTILLLNQVCSYYFITKIHNDFLQFIGIKKADHSQYVYKTLYNQSAVFNVQFANMYSKTHQAYTFPSNINNNNFEDINSDYFPFGSLVSNY